MYMDRIEDGGGKRVLCVGEVLLAGEGNCGRRKVESMWLEEAIGQEERMWRK
jgi:hypothetical protein